MNTAEHRDTNLYQAPATDVVGQFGEFDESSMFSPRGRAGRLRYFGYAIGIGFSTGIIIGVLSGIVGAISGNPNATAGVMAIVSMVAYIVVMAATIIFMIKRLHDLNWTGWLSLLTLVPLVNILFGLILIFAPGNAEPNKYGPPPKPENSVMAVIVITLGLVALIGIIAAVTIPAYQDYVNRAKQVQQHY